MNTSAFYVIRRNYPEGPLFFNAKIGEWRDDVRAAAKYVTAFRATVDKDEWNLSDCEIAPYKEEMDKLGDMVIVCLD